MSSSGGFNNPYKDLLADIYRKKERGDDISSEEFKNELKMIVEMLNNYFDHVSKNDKWSK